MRRSTICETERLTIRRLALKDAPFILALLNDPDFLRNIGDRNARTIADARRYLARGPMASYRLHGHGLYLVSITATGDSIGICGLLKRDTLDDVDIGFAFLPQFRRRGYAIESARAMLAYARTGLGLSRVVAIVQPGNERSIQLLERLGMRIERTVRMPPDDRELLLFGAGW